MTCYHPLRAFVLGVKADGKKILKITKAECNLLIYNRSTDSYETEFSDNPLEKAKKITLLNNCYKVYTQSMLIPCGQCVGCRLDYSREWATRLMLEKTYHPQAYFVTLTYDDAHISHLNRVSCDLDTGEVRNAYTLDKRDLQLFMKRLRKQYDKLYPDGKIRFYACGEYGSQTARPHYHLILFMNLPAHDLKFIKRSKLGDDYFSSDLIGKCWTYGFNLVANVTWQSCAYVSRYIMKKQKGDNARVYDDWNINPEFVLMSRKPGIAKLYYEDNVNDLIEQGNIILQDGNIAPICKYFNRMLEVDFPDIAETMKEKRRKLAEDLAHTKENLYNMDYLDVLEHQEKAKLSKINSLVRDL